MHAVASRTGEQRVVGGGAFIEGAPVPEVGQTSLRDGYVLRQIVCRVDGQVQSNDAVATVFVAANNRVLRGSRGRLRVGLPVPGEGLARHCRGVAVGLVVDSQVQGHDGVAAVMVATDNGVLRGSCWRLGISLPVPGERLACHGRGVAVGLVVDGQVQSNDAVAPVFIAADDGVLRGSRRCLGISLPVPGERLACHGRGVAVGRVVDC